MADGDDATNAGMDVPSGSDKVKDGFREIAKTRDYLARKTGGVGDPLPIPLGGTGATSAEQARIALGVEKTLTSANSEGKVPAFNANGQLPCGTPSSSGQAANKGYVDNAIAGIDTGSGKVSKTGDTMSGSLTISGSGHHLYVPASVSASSGYTVAYINGDGRLARGASSERYKHDIRPISPMDLGDLFPVLHTFVMNDDPGEMDRIGYIAERLNEVESLRPFVVYEREPVHEIEHVVEYDDEGEVAAEYDRPGRIIGSQLVRDEHGDPVPDSIDFIALLIAQVAQLNERVKELEARDGH